MAESKVQEQLGPYRIVGRLGKGGMATIHEAVTAEGETVAVKVISAEFVQKTEFVKRFSRETQVYATLKHPGIVNIRDSGQVGDQFYVVMDLIPGRTLDTLLEVGYPQDTAWACDLMASMLDALHVAHSKGIVHRDMKPSNVMITPAGRPVILDFGIAHVTNATTITQTGAFLGTPAYVAPEMVQVGYTSQPAFDLYSCGVMLYEMVAGRLPFVSDTPMGTLFQHMQERPKPPRSFNPDLSRRVQTVILRALEKDPGRRAKSAGDMAAELRTAATDDPAAEAIEPEYFVESEPQPVSAESPPATGGQATILTARSILQAPDWSCVNRVGTLTLRILEGGEGHKNELAQLQPGATIEFQVSDARMDGNSAADGDALTLLAVTVTEDADRRDVIPGGVLLRLRRVHLMKLADALGKQQRFDLELLDKCVLRLRWVPRPVSASDAAEKRRRAPDREEVPIPSPTFAAGEKWTMYTTPFPYSRTPPGKSPKGDS